MSEAKFTTNIKWGSKPPLSILLWNKKCFGSKLNTTVKWTRQLYVYVFFENCYLYLEKRFCNFLYDPICALLSFWERKQISFMLVCTHKLMRINLSINDQCSPVYGNQSIDLYLKLIDWFLYDVELWSLTG